MKVHSCSCSLSRVQLREREIVLSCVRGGSRVKSLCDSDLLGVAGHSSSSTVEPAPPSGEGEWYSSSTADDLQWWPGDTIGKRGSLSPVILSPPLFHVGLSKLCSQCTVYM